MNGDKFASGSLMHGLCVLLCLAAVAAYAFLGRKREEAQPAMRWFVGGGCLVAWLINTTFWMWPSRFIWEQALPLHFCNMANLIGAVAVLARRRLFQAVIYFWALALCIWAFLTPTVEMGPRHAEFWIFWLYHAFILIAVAHVLVIDRFRPEKCDLLQVVAFTAAYTGILIAVNYQWGWNYGFVGPSKPNAPTLIDALGPYPLRLLWIALLALGLFVLCYLPWIRKGRGNDRS